MKNLEVWRKVAREMERRHGEMERVKKMLSKVVV